MLADSQVMAIYFIFFALGLIIGSFLNVVIYRFNTQRSLGGRSACLYCGHALSWYELIPLFSFIVQRGRCRKCKTKLSYQYFWVELATGIIFATVYWKFSSLIFVSTPIFALNFLFYTKIFSILLVVLVYDLKHKIIPDFFAFTFGFLTFAGLFLFDGHSFSPHVPALIDFLAGPVLALPFAVLWLFSRGEWMGLGDAKLTLGIGWLLGITQGIAALMIAFWSGAIIGVMLMLLGRKYSMKSEIPFAPYLILGTFLMFLFKLSFIY